MKVLIINGPNLNLVGTREPEVYGNTTFDEFLEEIKDAYFDCDIHYYQSNVEGDLINKLQEADTKKYKGIILNAGGYTHTSVAIRDAIASIKTPVIEVHISNPMSREEFRHTSLITGVCKGIIAGFGLDSYVLAIDSIIS
ncbi:MAG: type II 3-dehydroquinate dehydratase [Bacteroidota bacterium]